VCTVNYGVLTGISPGTAKITAEAYDGDKKYYASFDVMVVNPVVPDISEAEVYYVPLASYGIKSDNTDSANTTHGIQAAMNYAAANGYKKTVFPYGTYLVTPTARSLYLPTHMIVDFSNSIINIEPGPLTATGYRMFYFDNVSYTKLANAKIYGEADHTTLGQSVEGCLSVFIANAYKSGLESCVISKSPGFNIATHASRGPDQFGRHPSKDHWQPGNIDPVTGANDDTVTHYHFRSINYLNVSQLGSHYFLGYSQGYFGYPYLRSRLYTIYFYDVNHTFIEAHKYNLQFYNYNKPANAFYAKLVIYQDNAPSAHDTDFSAVAMLRTYTMPTECFIRNCTIEDNFSCGIAMTGGQSWTIEGNTFARNGKRMPACDIDWEDGWDAAVGDICRNNTFHSNNGIFLVGGSNIVLYGNTFKNSHLGINSRISNWKAYNNTFEGKSLGRNVNLACQAESYFERNILRGVNFSQPKKEHVGASYKVHVNNNTFL